MANPFQNGGPVGPPPGANDDTGVLMAMLAAGFQRETSTEKVRRAVKILEEVRKIDDRLAPRMNMVLDMLRGGPELDLAGGTRTSNDPDRS